MNLKTFSLLSKFALFSLLITAMACQPKNTEQNANRPVDLNKDKSLTYKDLKIYPIIADEAFIKANQASANLSSLAEVIQEPKFRITEQVEFGHTSEGHINALTVQNKTDHNVFLMEGEVVTGGKQDRVIGEEVIVAERSLKNIPVFCVEQDRWTYSNDQKQAESADDKVFAFRGHYNMASSKVRAAVRSGDQQKVWDQVAEVTKANSVKHKTKTYAGLSSSERFKHLREQYLLALKDGFGDQKVVGIIAVSGNKIIGADLFGAPALFQKQYQTLLHSYVTDAITQPGEKEVSAQQLEDALDKMNEVVEKKQGYRLKDALVHFGLI